MPRAKKVDQSKLPQQSHMPVVPQPQVMMPQHQHQLHQHAQQVAMPHMMPQHQMMQQQQPMPHQIQPHQMHQVPPTQQPPVQPQPVAQNTMQRIDPEHFLSVRDSAITRLTTIMGLVRGFAEDYIRQTNLLMGLGDQISDEHSAALLANFNDAAQQLMLGPLDVAGGEDKKERKKRTHDPNAPKRPLTPYFLYMQHARSIIANDLGADAPKGATQQEGQRRWQQMSSHEKQGWNNAYQYNLRLYNARVHAYKHGGNPLAKDMSDDDAQIYANANNIPMPEAKDADAHANHDAGDHDAIAEQLADDAKTPKKGGAANRKRKSDVNAPGMDMTPQLASGAASPDKKRRRTSTKNPEDAEPKKSRGKKTK